MKFKTVDDAPTSGGRTKLYPQLQELKDLTIKAWDEDYEPESREEEEAIETIRQYEETAWAVIEETPEAATAYSRAASLRKANLPKGTWAFRGQKVTNDDGKEGGEVLARYISVEEAEPDVETDEE